MALIPYTPVAVVVRLPDGQLMVLHGQSKLVETSTEPGITRSTYETTIKWREPFTITRLPKESLGIELHDDEGPSGPVFSPSPLLPTDGE